MAAESAADPLPMEVAHPGRRLGADVLDLALLGIVLIALGAALQPVFFSIGPWARLISFALAVAYFTVFNSRLGRGRTPGKWAMQLVVMDADGAYLPVSQAFVRSLLIGVVLIFNNWRLPLFAGSVAGSILIGVIFVGGALALVTGYVFNRARQGPHDLLAGSYVVHNPAPYLTYRAPLTSPTIKSLMVSLLTVGGIAGFLLYGASATPELADLAHAINADGDYFYVSVVREMDGDLTRLDIEAWYGGDCDGGEDCGALVDGIAQTVLAEYDGRDIVRAIDIRLVNRVDLYLGFSVNLDPVTYEVVQRRSFDVSRLLEGSD